MWGQSPLRQAQGRLSVVRRAKLDSYGSNGNLTFEQLLPFDN